MFFTISTLALLFLVLITTYCLFFIYAKVVSEDDKKNIEFYNTGMATVLQASYLKKSNFNNLTSSLQKKKLLRYAYILDTKLGKVVWSLDENIIKLGLSKEEILPLILDFQVDKSDINEANVPVGTSQTLYLGFAKDEGSTEEIDSLMLSMYLSFVLFAMLSFASSMYLGKLIQEPLDKLTTGIQKFGEGDFEYRVKKTQFLELNQIVDSYNKMASELDTLYNDLESKVVERTEALEAANKELKETQSIMVHAEKMRSLGELVAGIAHEINNPINFIYGNMVHFENYVNDIFDLFDKYEQLKSKVSEIDFKEIEEYKEEIDIEFLRTDIKDLIVSCRDGADRAKNIIADLKNFSRLDETTLTEFDIPKEIDTTLNILYNKFKHKVEIVKNYPDDLPKIEAYGRQLNQVFMNILDNAIYAIKEKGTITISSYVNPDKETISIEIEDTGVGIKEEDIKKVFDPFWTTKPVGQGTGLGMSIAYKVISSHNGYAEVSSKLNVGTKFRIVLPISQNKGKENEV